MILGTLQSFHGLDGCKVGCCASSEVASRSASFWLLPFLLSCFKAVWHPVASLLWLWSIGFTVVQSIEDNDLCVHLKTTGRNGCNSADAECSCPLKPFLVFLLICRGAGYISAVCWLLFHSWCGFCAISISSLVLDFFRECFTWCNGNW